MIINALNLRTLTTAFNAAFRDGLSQAPNDHQVITMETPSTTAEEEYGWLGQVPGMRAWVGDRVLHNLKEYGYKIRNVDFEQTVSVPRNAIEDDQYGVYATPMRLMGQAAAAHPCELVYQQLLKGFTERCYDGQFFFDTSHPVLDANGVPQPVSNFQAGTGKPWFLIATGALVKPIILQTRRDTNFVAKDRPDDEAAFFRKEYIYGADARRAAGFGLWQVIYASKAELNAANYAAARAAIMTLKGDYGRPLGLRPDLLLVDGSNEQKGLKLLNNAQSAGGESNEWQGTARLQVTPWLAA